MREFQNVLAFYGMRIGDEATLECAARLACANGSRLTLVDVVYADEVPGCLIEERRRHLDRLAESIRHRGVQTSTEVLLGRPDCELIRKVLRDAHDLVVLTDDSRQGLQELMFTSTCTRLMRRCPCPVWVVRPQSPSRARRVLALVEARRESPRQSRLDAKVLRLAGAFARAQSAALHVLKAWDVLGPDRETLRSETPEETRRGIVSRHRSRHCLAVGELLRGVDLAGLDCRVHLPRGDPQLTLPEFAREHQADLVVMGSNATGTIAQRLLGTTPEVVFAKVDCAVLTVKPDGFVSPLALPGA